MADKTLHCSVLTPEGSVFVGEVDSVTAVAADGEVGILPGHAALITALGTGELRVRQKGATQHWLVHGGFLEVLENKVVVLARALDRLDQLNLDQVRRDLESAAKMDRHVRQRAQESGDLSGDLAGAARARLRYAKKHGR
ncbi:MAG: ATP synthase F1 subunit epsilon [Planctomycetota bacterium]